MSPLTPEHRLALLMHGGLSGSQGKTGLALLRYSPLTIVAVIDHEQAGQDLVALTGIQRPVPIVESVAAALALGPTVLAIGIAPSGGSLPEPWYQEVKAAVTAGLSVVNGLHTPLSTDPALSPLQPHQWIWDVRQEPPGLRVGTAQARLLPCRRVLAVGTDMAVGKMSTNLELHRAAQAQGLRSLVVATGQTNLMLGYGGVALDAVRVDFAAGAVERAVLDAAKEGETPDILFIEGQGSIFNPASTATLPLLRGSQPTHLVLVHRVGQTQIKHCPHVSIPPLPEVIQVYEALATAAGAFLPAKVVAIVLNTQGLNAAAARTAIAATHTATQLPCTDVIRFGPDPILKAILSAPIPGAT